MDWYLAYLLVKESVEEVDAQKNTDTHQSRDECCWVDTTGEDELGKPDDPLEKKDRERKNNGTSNRTLK